ncbi:MAG TPA: hypothetical protein VKY73_17240 [Polyangiaceae bacterium]|nr:hypothetical protein [Polyangiaceae bacterium]
MGWVGVERLPGSAFPNEPVRGIKGGSLWMTFHGQQWPYMPAINGEAGLRLGFSGSVWADGSYARINSGLHPNKRHAKRLAMESRAVLRATPTYSTTNGWFVQGQAEIVALGDQITSGSFLGTTDDLYVRVGKWGLFDLTVGRFQGWEIANHYGMGLDLNTLEREGAALQEQAKPKPLYGLTYMWDRKDQRTGRYALHIYPLDILRFELLGEFGAYSGQAGGQAIYTGVRPSAILDLGILKLKGGLEYAKGISQKDGDPTKEASKGWGVAAQVVLDPYIEAGVSYAQGVQDFTNFMNVYLEDTSNNTWGAAGFANARILDGLIAGAGVAYSYWENLGIQGDMTSPYFGQPGFDRQLQAFGALQYSLWDTFFVKFVGSYAHFRHVSRTDTPFANKMLGGRLRFMALF